MNLNFSGFPIGAAIAGVMISYSLEGTVIFGVAANVVGALLGYLLIPRSDAPLEAAAAA
jgi:hypothetical protein